MKNGYFHVEIMISATHMPGVMLPSEKIFKNVQFGVDILIRFCIKFFFLMRSLCIEQYDICWWTFQVIFPMNKQK